MPVKYRPQTVAGLNLFVDVQKKCDGGEHFSERLTRAAMRPKAAWRCSKRLQTA
jgi:hypothetical protein